ncbi:unnamed protein product [Lathyrus sativus]|nr:unnamed protein product [Lathyrus sativus]
MAIYTVLRRATAAVIPLAARRTVASSSRTFHSALSVKLLSHQEMIPFVPSRSFANAVAKKSIPDSNLIKVLQSEINCALEDNEATEQVEIPVGFPFEIEDNPEVRTIQLKRQYEDEVITVQVDIPTRTPEENEGDDADDNEKNDTESSIPLVVTVFKGNGVSLEFGLTAYPDEVLIDSLSIKKPDDSEDELAYEGPEFTDLDENLQKAFLKYLEIRGITAGTTNFLQEYMFNKDSKEYLLWLKKVKSFVE